MEGVGACFDEVADCDVRLGEGGGREGGAREEAGGEEGVACCFAEGSFGVGVVVVGV